MRATRCRRRWTSWPTPTALRPTRRVRVMVRVLDQAGNKLPFYPEPVQIAVTGAAKLLGPALVPLRAGSTGFWIEADGTGKISVDVTAARLGTTRH